MIPRNISREHILQALSDIARMGVPKRREATRYALEHEDRRYPPKLVVSVANRYASGVELNPAGFSGGQETNEFLRQRGFRIIEVDSTRDHPAEPRPARTKWNGPSLPHRGERCPACKIRVGQLLEKLYGRVIKNYSIGLAAGLNDYRDTLHFRSLQTIHAALAAHRGFTDFVRARRLPLFDYFVGNPGFGVEFDETQHFTVPRAIALRHYPSALTLGYDRDRWESLCSEIQARDSDPPFRDEQRAWYDTLRDFAPDICGLQPTVRLFANDVKWCELDARSPADLETFRAKIENTVDQWNIQVRAEPVAAIARVILNRSWPGNIHDARALLKDVAGKWPPQLKVNFLVTCGGFVQFPFSEAVSSEGLDGGNDALLRTILDRAVRVANEVIPAELKARLRVQTRYLTLGIDTFKDVISTTQNRISERHAETVILFDLVKGTHHATAKSYPTTAKERGLIRSNDLEGHFLRLENGDVLMILGCHDLTIFNDRSRNARGWRAEVNAAFRLLAERKRPSVVLHHPHTTDHKMTWRHAWTGLERELPSLEIYAGAGRYWYERGDQRSSLDEVLRLTKKGPTIDFVVQ